MRELPKNFYPTILAIVTFFAVSACIYITDMLVKINTVPVLQDKIEAQGEYIKKLIIELKE